MRQRPRVPIEELPNQSRSPLPRHVFPHRPGPPATARGRTTHSSIYPTCDRTRRPESHFGPSGANFEKHRYNRYRVQHPPTANFPPPEPPASPPSPTRGTHPSLGVKRCSSAPCGALDRPSSHGCPPGRAREVPSARGPLRGRRRHQVRGAPPRARLCKKDPLHHTISRCLLVVCFGCSLQGIDQGVAHGRPEVRIAGDSVCGLGQAPARNPWHTSSPSSGP